MTTATDTPWLSFKLEDEFVASYAERPVPWGFPCGGGLSLGELAFVTKYSRLKPDGTKERWHECVRRFVEGTYSILKDHCVERRTPWDEAKAQRSAREAYDRAFHFKWLPPGRGLWMMGTEFVHQQRNSAALQNCAFVSTEHRGLPAAAARLMEMSMLGVGVGFDSRGVGGDVHVPQGRTSEWSIPDTREGWCESTEALLRSYLEPGHTPVRFTYERIRAAGEPIRGYGGVAAGPEPLIELHRDLRRTLDEYALRGRRVDSLLIGDVMNLVGRCVVAGNVRRSAEIWLGEADDKAFLESKNAERYPERNAMDTGWGWASNNSVIASVGERYDHLVEPIVLNGEPGLVYLDLCRAYGRLADPPNHKDYRVAGINPCGEQPLEDGEMCTLVNAYPTRATDLDDHLRTLKFAYLYGKAVTLFATHWEDTNEVMRRNHRIGASLSGQALFVEHHGWAELKRWEDEGYAEIQRWDRIYSEWLGVRESIKTTTVKPDGTTPLLVGCTSGVSWPVDGDAYVRRMRFGADEPIVAALVDAGVPVEPDVTDPRRVVAELPVRGLGVRGEAEVSLWEKAELAALAQRHWSDNAVSVTLSFREDEADQVDAVIHAFDGRLKTLSFLPITDAGAYPQMPQESVSREELERRWAEIADVDTDALYGPGARDAEGTKFCDGESCEIDAAPGEHDLVRLNAASGLIQLETTKTETT